MNITITNRITQRCIQGGPGVKHSLRMRHFTASEAPAMLGVSKCHAHRSAAHEKPASSLTSPSGRRRSFSTKGHDAEAAARPIVEASSAMTSTR